MTIKDFESILRKIYPNARMSDIVDYAPHIAYVFEKYQINTLNRQRHYLAQIGHESGELRYREEIASGARYNGRRDLGNDMPGDGVKYKGRGQIMLTGKFNYGSFDKFMKANGEILKRPERVATDTRLNAEAAGWFWHTRNINKLADKNDFVAITRIINGGVNGLKDRRRLLTNAERNLTTPVIITEEAQTKLIIETNPTPIQMDPKDIQWTLNRAAKTRLVLDGIIGPKSKTAIRKFQGLQKLSVNGDLNFATLNALQKAFNELKK